MATLNQTFINDIDEDKVAQLLDQTNNNVAYFTNVSDQVVKSYTFRFR